MTLARSNASRGPGAWCGLARGGWIWAALALAWALAHPAPAQLVGSMPPGWHDPPITKRELKAYMDRLDLDSDQRELARDLQEGNRLAHKAITSSIADRLRAAAEKANESGNWDSYNARNKELSLERVREYEKLERSFFEDLEALLITDAQRARMEGVHRLRRRETLMRYGIFAAMSWDVLACLEAIKIPRDAAPDLPATLDEYEQRLDSLLIAYERHVRQIQKEWIELGRRPPREKREQAAKGVENLTRPIRDLNRETAKRVMLALDDASRASLEKELRRRAFPRLAREAYADKALKAAASFDDLTPTQRETLSSITESYTRVRDQTLADVQRMLEAREEAAGGRLSMYQSGGWWNDQPSRDLYENSSKKRKQAEETAATKLEALLSEAQRLRLPTRTPEQRADGGLEDEWGWKGLGQDEGEQEP